VAKVDRLVAAMRNSPRVNIQRAKGGKAEPYQVTQFLKAIDKLSKEETT
jgi:hypothetical protein